ncbi:MAG: hypothetical protein ABSH22_20990 [Tepidisphaeraceae bacterium]|jgi:hypothetical protein
MTTIGPASSRIRRRLSKTLHAAALAGAAVLLLCGGLSSQPTAYSAPPKISAWLEAKPVCVFPLDGTSATLLPRDRAGLIQSLDEGMKRLAVIPDQSKLVQTEETAYPALAKLRIDLSNSTEDADHMPPKLNWHFAPRDGLHVARFEVIADPLLIRGAKVKYDLTATDAQLSFAHDRQDRPALLLTQAKSGHVDINASKSDVQTLCLAAAKRFASKYGFSVNAIQLKFSTPNDKTLLAEADVALSGMGGHLNLTGRFVVADDGTGNASHLTCRGQGPGGIFLASLLTGGLLAYDNTSKPLVEFPFDHMTLRNAKFHVEGAPSEGNLHITADFGSDQK